MEMYFPRSDDSRAAEHCEEVAPFEAFVPQPADFSTTVNLDNVKLRADGNLEPEGLREEVLRALSEAHGDVKACIFTNGETIRKSAINTASLIEIHGNPMILKVVGGVLGDCCGLPRHLPFEPDDPDYDPRGTLGHDQDVLVENVPGVVRCYGYVTDGKERIIAVLREYVPGVTLQHAMNPEKLSHEHRHLAIADAEWARNKVMETFLELERRGLVVVDQEYGNSLHVRSSPDTGEPEILLTDSNLFAKRNGRSPFGVKDTVDMFFGIYTGKLCSRDRIGGESQD